MIAAVRCKHLLIKDQCSQCNGSGIKTQDEYIGSQKVGVKFVHQPRPKVGPTHVKNIQVSKVCKVHGCNKRGNERGFCHTHYIAWRQGRLKGFPPFVRKRIDRGSCLICGDKHKGHGLCGKCIQRWRRGTLEHPEYGEYDQFMRRREMNERKVEYKGWVPPDFNQQEAEEVDIIWIPVPAQDRDDLVKRLSEVGKVNHRPWWYQASAYVYAGLERDKVGVNNETNVGE